MAQTLKSKLLKLSEAYNIKAIVETAQQLQIELADRNLWDSMTDQEKTDWFMNQCKKYNLTTNQVHNQIKVRELPEIGSHKGTRAYFTVFLPRDESLGRGRFSQWRLEIGGSYIENHNGGIWITNPGLKGKEQQIAEVMRLHNQGE